MTASRVREFGASMHWSAGSNPGLIDGSLKPGAGERSPAKFNRDAQRRPLSHPLIQNFPSSSASELEAGFQHIGPRRPSELSPSTRLPPTTFLRHVYSTQDPRTPSQEAGRLERKQTSVLLNTNRAATSVRWRSYENEFVVSSGARHDLRHGPFSQP